MPPTLPGAPSGACSQQRALGDGELVFPAQAASVPVAQSSPALAGLGQDEKGRAAPSHTKCPYPCQVLRAANGAGPSLPHPPL